MANIVYMARSAWTGLLDTIRSKAGITGNMTVSQAASAVDSIETGGGGDDSFDRLVDRTITEARGSATTIGTYAFYSCSSLTTISFPLAKTIGSSAFYSCTRLTTASFPSVTSIGGSAFNFCTRLTTASFPSAISIGSFAFHRCFTLLSVYFMGSSVPSLYSPNVFTSTPIRDYTDQTSGVYGSIFVPASLYDQYISATNWSLYSSRFVSVAE